MSYSEFSDFRQLPIYNPKTNLDFVKAIVQQPGVVLPQNYHKLVLTQNITDVDHFPYTRYYRGQHQSDFPYIHSRCAGYRVLTNDLYKPPLPEHSTEPYLNPMEEFKSSIPFSETVFEGGCCNTFPSYHPDRNKPNFTLGYSSHIPITSINNR